MVQCVVFTRHLLRLICTDKYMKAYHIDGLLLQYTAPVKTRVRTYTVDQNLSPNLRQRLCLTSYWHVTRRGRYT